MCDYDVCTHQVEWYGFKKNEIILGFITILWQYFRDDYCHNILTPFLKNDQQRGKKENILETNIS